MPSVAGASRQFADRHLCSAFPGEHTHPARLLRRSFKVTLILRAGDDADNTDRKPPLRDLNSPARLRGANRRDRQTLILVSRGMVARNAGGDRIIAPR